MLLEEATHLGPVVGLGDPRDDQKPPYGVARGYFDNKAWPEAVASLASNSSAIVLCLSDTNSLLWEIDYLAKANHLNKTLFLSHPKYMGSDDNTRLMVQLSDHLGFDEEIRERLRTPDPRLSQETSSASVVGLFLGKSGQYQVIRSSTFSRFAYLLTLRTFFREELEKRA